MKIVAIYDNGGSTIDRLTVVTNNIDIFRNRTAMFSTDINGGSSFSQWSEGEYNSLFDKNDNIKRKSHLGKRVYFESLPAEVQKDIARRVLL